MSDIHQEWKELRQKNGDFINHLDGEVAKLDKKQVELKRVEQLQGLTDAGAFAMQFVAPPPFNCCQDDRDILKALNKAQADRIKSLEDAIIAYKEQKQVDLAVKKDLDEKLDKAAADYKALWVENDRLKSQLASEKEDRRKDRVEAARRDAASENEKDRLTRTIRDLEERNKTLRERLANVNESLKRSIQESNKNQEWAAYLDNRRRLQAKELKRLQDIVNTPNGSCSAYTQQGMQSKIAKQAAEIKRLTEENEILKDGYSDQTKQISGLLAAQATLKLEIETLHKALDIAAKDADENFERGKIKGMKEIWKELVNCYDGRQMSENNKIFGYHTVGEILMNLSPTWFINRAEEYHKQEEKKASDIQIGDEVEIFDKFCPDDDPHSDIGIVVAVDSDGHSFAVVGPKFEGCFDETDIQSGIVKKTGQHFDSIPLNYFSE